MTNILLQTKLHIPPLRPSLIPRPHLIEKLKQGLHMGSKLTLISAPAGFGKTTIVREWIDQQEQSVAWVSLDEGDSDPTRFLTYFVAALQGLTPEIGKAVQANLQSPQPSSIQSNLTILLNEIATLPHAMMLVLDDYHMVDAQPIDQALAFLLKHLPAQMHLIMTTREDPTIPLAQLRARGQMTELRAADLRFNHEEATQFLQEGMGLHLSPTEIDMLEARTEGWIVGFQLAALSLQGYRGDSANFIQAFTGSHRFILDYLVEEVLQQQSDSRQRFLLHTSILNQLNASLCNALTEDNHGQETLEMLERHNLFLVPLDDKRRWYRYHHLFAELLQQQLQKSTTTEEIAILHIRASDWYEKQGLTIEAFHHATAAQDIDRAIRLVEGEGMPLYYQGVITPVLQWLEGLSSTVLAAQPTLGVMYASVLMMTGQPNHHVEDILHQAEVTLQQVEANDQTNDLLGQIAGIRAMLAIPQNQVETIIIQSQRALDLLHPDNLPVRTTTTWTLGYAYQVQGNRAAASQAYRQTIAHSQRSGNVMSILAATTCLGQIQETNNQLQQAAQSYQQVLQLVGDSPWATACEAYVGLARLHYQWNDLTTAQAHVQQSLTLAQQLENVDTPVACGVLLARLQLAQGDISQTLTQLADAEQLAHQYHFTHWLDKIAEVRILALLQQGNIKAATKLAQSHPLPVSQARVHLAQGEFTTALDILASAYQEAITKEWADEQLQVMVLQAVVYQEQGEQAKALAVLDDVLALAMPQGFIRLFVDEGAPMFALLRASLQQATAPTYVHQLLAAFGEEEAEMPSQHALREPLTERELDVLRLLGTELNGPEIANQLMVSLNTMRTHTKSIYSKLGVSNRRMAVSQAKALHLL